MNKVKEMWSDHKFEPPRRWCMCTELKGVARDMNSTCQICGGIDAYGTSIDRPPNKKKTIPLQKLKYS